MNNSPQNKQFWLNLLAYPDDNQRRTDVWNGYLAWKLPTPFRHKIRNIGNPPFNQYEQGQRLALSREDQHALNALADDYGGHPKLLERSAGPLFRYMDTAYAHGSGSINML